MFGPYYAPTHIHIKEKLESQEFANVNQVLQRALAKESLSKEFRPKSNRLNMRMFNCDSLDDEDRCVYMLLNLCGLSAIDEAIVLLSS